MHLSEKDVQRFYQIWLPLLHYVNQKKSILPGVSDDYDDIRHMELEEVAKIRDVLWDNVNLIDQYIEDNPASLSDAGLAIASSWKDRLTGSFYIFRYLKSGAVFLLENQAYLVQGITGSFEDMFGDYFPLPFYAKTVLIPFEDKIIYDSLIAPYSVFFGGGIKRSLNETYKRIQEREGVITSLGTVLEGEALLEQIEKSNKKVLRAFEKDMGKSGLSAKKMLEHKDNIATFAEEFMLQTVPPQYLLDIEPADLEAYLSSSQKKINKVSFKRFARFLRDTYRIDYDIAEDLLDLLKS